MGSDAVDSRRTRRSRAAGPTRGDHREQALLETAERLLRKGGWDAASIQQLTASAGITRSAFYFYFDSKSALLATLIDRTLRELSERIDEELDPDVDTVAAQLRRAVATTGRAWSEHRDVLVAAVGLAATVPAVAELWRRNVEDTLDRLTALLVHAAGPRAITHDPDEARAVMRALVWMTERNFFLMMQPGPASTAEREALEERLTRILLTTFDVT